MEPLIAMNFNGYVLSHYLNDLQIHRFSTITYYTLKMHFHISAGTKIENFVKYGIQNQLKLWACYTPKLGEILSSENFRKTKDLSFINVVSVGGAKMTSSLYEKVEKESSLIFKKYLIVNLKTLLLLFILMI